MKWLGAHIRQVFGFLVSAGLLAAWLAGSSEPLVPSPARAWLALENTVQKTPSPSEDRFRIVLCWLKGDGTGKDSGTVEEAFSGVPGIELVRSARIVTARGAADDLWPVMQKRARAVMEDWDADLAIVGFVKNSKVALTLWFVPYANNESEDDDTLRDDDKPYRLEDVTLTDEFHEDLRAELTATALAAVAPFVKTEARGQVLQEGLQAATEKLSRLLDGGTITSVSRRSDLQTALGDALLALGEREVAAARLRQAVEAYRKALEGRPRVEMPLQWAKTQSKLGSALTVLGEREGDTDRLEEAVGAFTLALEEQAGPNAATSRAETQVRLGNALLAWGKLDFGTARLEQAVAAYREALAELSRTRLDTPLEWAAAQHNLGNALAAWGERSRNVALLKEAISVFHLALEERTRLRVPLAWARTQGKLGMAHAILSESERTTPPLNDAIATFRLALEEFTLTEAPLDWASTQINLGNALAIIGYMEDDMTRIEGALEVYRLVIVEFPQVDAPLVWALAQTNLGNALATLGEHSSDMARFEQANVAFRSALEVYKDKKMFREVVSLQLKLWWLHRQWFAPWSAR